MKSFKVKLSLISVIVSFLISFLSPKLVLANTLFQDNFEEQNFNNWNTIVNSGAWSLQNIQNSYRFGSSNPGIEAEADAGDYSWGDYEFSVDILPISGIDRNLMFRVTNQRTTPFNLNLPIAYGIHMYPNQIWLQKFTSNGIQEPVTTNINLADNQVTNIRVRAVGNNIKIYLGNDINPTIDWTDNNNPILHGEIGLLITGNSQVWFDNVLVTGISSLPVLNVPDIKQYSSPWGAEVYDHATSWSNNPTIDRWGCALTSADMILQYYGFPINPDALNTWLNSQPDGYVGDGLLNWLAVSRYTKINFSPQGSLEFLRLGNTNQNLINELNNNRPAILEEPGHFIVATGQTQTSFNINDPAYTNHPTLDSYANTFASIETYTPSHTNLSYIMLTINPGFNIKVYDTNGNEITGDTFIQSPLIDDINNVSTSGNPLKIFMFPKPANGNYKVEVTGNGIYELDSYLYDLNGNVNINKFNAITGNNEIDNYKTTIGPSNQTTVILTIDSITNDWKDVKISNKVKSSYVYNQVLSMLNFANKLISTHQSTAAKTMLKATILFIKTYTPSLIDSGVSSIMQNEIQTLINSL